MMEDKKSEKKKGKVEKEISKEQEDIQHKNESLHKAGSIVKEVKNFIKPQIKIVAKALEEELTVVPIPGANAALSALISSGLSTLSFTFLGFLPRQKKERRAALENIKYKQETMLFYEAPHRLKETLRDAESILGSTRKVVLARELTKKFEEFVRGSLEEAVQWAETEEIRGELPQPC
jgi:16S rRNA (cytidine1402-2'-O)-methyltransferase